MDSSCLYLLSTDRLVLVWSGWRRAEWGVRSGPRHNTTGPEFSRKATPPSPPSPGQGNLFQHRHTTHYYAILGGGWASGHAGQGHSSPQGFTCHKSQGDSDSDKGLILTRVLTVFAEEAVWEAEFAGALVRVAAAVAGEELLPTRGLG